MFLTYSCYIRFWLSLVYIPLKTYILNDDQLQEVELKLDRYNAPYVLTKPFHHSQEVLEKLKDGSVVIKVKVHMNFEFDRLILGFGDSIEVIKPRILKNRIKKYRRETYVSFFFPWCIAISWVRHH